jgi:hypothetical protein
MVSGSQRGQNSSTPTILTPIPRVAGLPFLPSVVLWTALRGLGLCARHANQVRHGRASEGIRGG